MFDTLFRLNRRLRALGRDASGIAITEFALFAPVLAFGGLASLEAANLVVNYSKVYGIALKTADNIARVRTSIDEADVKEVFIGAKLMGETIQFGQNGRIIVSSIEPVMNTTVTPNTVQNQWIRWQRCYGAHAANSTHGAEGDGATGTAQATGYGVPGKPKIVAAERTAVILVEVVYTYQPLISNNWLGVQTITAQRAIPVRQRTDQALKNAGNLSAANRALCSNAHTA